MRTGVIVAGAAWLLSSALLSRARQWRWVAVVGLSLPVCALAVGVALLIADGGQLFPATEDALGSWLNALEFAVVPIALCWPLAVLTASRPDAVRQRTANKHASCDPDAIQRLRDRLRRRCGRSAYRGGMKAALPVLLR